MPSLSEVLEFRDRQFQKSRDLIEKKGADYNRDQQQSGDTLFNLKVAEILGIVPSTEEGILVRLSDKLMRLISLTKPGRDAAIKDESVLDTIADIHNYVDYLGLIWLQRRERGELKSLAKTVNPRDKQREAVLDPRPGSLMTSSSTWPRRSEPAHECEGGGSRGY